MSSQIPTDRGFCEWFNRAHNYPLTTEEARYRVVKQAFWNDYVQELFEDEFLCTPHIIW
jgi:hypothetical protein